MLLFNSFIKSIKNSSFSSGNSSSIFSFLLVKLIILSDVTKKLKNNIASNSIAVRFVLNVFDSGISIT